MFIYFYNGMYYVILSCWRHIALWLLTNIETAYLSAK